MSYTPPPPPEGGSEGSYGAPQDPNGGQYGGGQQPPGQYPPGPGYGAPPPTGNNTKAVIALVLGILGFVFAICCSLLGLVIGIAALVLGRLSRKEIALTGGAQGGDGMARAGFVLGIVDIVIAVILIILGIVLSANGYNPFQISTSP
ncbi:MAG: DUF4190 domain-containing protein [Nocardioidaceae bacterium]